MKLSIYFHFHLFVFSGLCQKYFDSCVTPYQLTQNKNLSKFSRLKKWKIQGDKFIKASREESSFAKKRKGKRSVRNTTCVTNQNLTINSFCSRARRSVSKPA